MRQKTTIGTLSAPTRLAKGGNFRAAWKESTESDRDDDLSHSEGGGDQAVSRGIGCYRRLTGARYQAMGRRIWAPRGRQATRLDQRAHGGILAQVNPWLEIPLSDYEGHMALPTIGQSQLIARELATLVREQSPRSVAVIGCSIPIR